MNVKSVFRLAVIALKVPSEEKFQMQKTKFPLPLVTSFHGTVWVVTYGLDYLDFEAVE